MRDSVKLEFEKSSSLFTGVVWPRIKGCEIWHSGEIISAEDNSDEMKRILDVYAGIDAWHIVKKKALVRGVASRVQEVQGAKPFNTFSIRYMRDNGQETEYQKRKSALDNMSEGHLFPHLTVQSYIQDEELVSAAAIKTSTLFEAIERLLGFGKLRDGSDPRFGIRRTKNASFIYLSWEYLENTDFKEDLHVFKR